MSSFGSTGDGRLQELRTKRKVPLQFPMFMLQLQLLAPCLLALLLLLSGCAEGKKFIHRR